MKKLIAILLVMTMAVCALPMSAFADYDAEPIEPQYIEGGNYHICIKGAEKLVPVGTVISYGSKGTYVTTAQMKLNEVDEKEHAGCSAGAVDGDFGVNTQNATFTFQGWFNGVRHTFGEAAISADGIIGNQTWNAFSILFYPWG